VSICSEYNYVWQVCLLSLFLCDFDFFQHLILSGTVMKKMEILGNSTIVIIKKIILPKLNIDHCC